MAKRSEKTVNCTFQNQRHCECEFPRGFSNAKGQRSGSDVRDRTATKRGSRPSPAFDFVRLDSKSLGEKVPVRIYKDEAPTPLPAVGLLFISLLSFHFSRALLGALAFLFCFLFFDVCYSFHNRRDLIREPVFNWVFFFFFFFLQFILVCFIIYKDEQVLCVLVH